MRACLVTLSASLVLAIPASAQRQLAPPGNSGVSQYLETIPAAGGNETPRRSKKPVLSEQTRRALRARGADGSHLEELVNASSGDSKSRDRERRRSGAARRAPVPDVTRDERSPLRSAADALLGQSDSEGGAGSLLPVFLIGSTLLLAAAAVIRRRRA